MQPLRIAVIGMGGFAASHHDAVRELEGAGECKLVCTCDPDPAAFEQRMLDLDLAGRGVRMFDDYLTMLDECSDKLDIVTIPTPVPLHAEMHRACVERGLAVYLEKPPTLDWRELDRMIEVDRQATKLTNVGFNFIDDPVRQTLKQRVVAGEFGVVREIGLKGLWPRPRAYYTRAPWAARLMMNGRLVLDSCMGNALAHFVHNALFWAGKGEVLSWAAVQSARAELYRAHDIEGMDTVFTSAELDGGASLRIALTHACDGSSSQSEWLTCERATIHYSVGGEFRIEWNDGRVETGPAGRVLLVTTPLSAYFAYVRGLTDRPTTRLEDCRPFVSLCDLVYVAAGHITTVSEPHLNLSPATDGNSECVAIHEIRPVVDRFLDTGRFPSDQGVEWAEPGGEASVDDLQELERVISAMVSHRKGLQ